MASPKVPPPPYDTGKVPYPLTADARKKIVAWLGVWHTDTGTGPTLSDLAHLSNNDLSAIYLTIVNDWHDTEGGTKDKSGGEISHIPVVGPAISSVTDFLQLLVNPHFWMRLLEVGIGAILLGVGLAKLTNAGPSLSKIPLYGKMIP